MVIFGRYSWPHWCTFTYGTAPCFHLMWSYRVDACCLCGMRNPAISALNDMGYDSLDRDPEHDCVGRRIEAAVRAERRFLAAELRDMCQIRGGQETVVFYDLERLADHLEGKE